MTVVQNSSHLKTLVEAVHFVASCVAQFKATRSSSVVGLDPVVDPEIFESIQKVASAATDHLSRRATLIGVGRRYQAEIAAIAAVSGSGMRRLIERQKLEPRRADEKYGRILKLLNREHDENLHSDFLAMLLRPSTCGDFAYDLAARISGGKLSPRPKFQFVQREVILQNLGFSSASQEIGLRRLDLLIERDDAVIVIENKVLSTESESQTEDYALAVMEAYRWSEKPLHFVLLSPAGSIPRSSNFNPVSYGALRSMILEGVQLIPEVVKPAAMSYLASLDAVIGFSFAAAISQAQKFLEEYKNEQKSNI